MRLIYGSGLSAKPDVYHNPVLVYDCVAMIAGSLDLALHDFVFSPPAARRLRAVARPCWRQRVEACAPCLSVRVKTNYNVCGFSSCTFGDNSVCLWFYSCIFGVCVFTIFNPVCSHMCVCVFMALFVCFR